MKGPLQLLFAVLFVLVTVVRGVPKTLTYNWTVDYSVQSPDCVEKLMPTINGQYPGPTIRATVNDTIVVNIENLMPTEIVVIHWHGMLQTGTPWADGAAYISQCPILPLEKYTYTFVVEQAGTYFYHGHQGLQMTGGLYGSLIVDEEHGTVPFTYDGEFNIMMTDWWHSSMYRQEFQLFNDPFKWLGRPHSLLIGGLGKFDCSPMWPTGFPIPPCNMTCCESPGYVLEVEPNKTYRLRLTSMAAWEGLTFVVEDHNLTVIEVSGHYVKPIVVQNVNIYSGETYSVLLTTDLNPSRNYWVSISDIGYAQKLPNQTARDPIGVALLNYLPNLSTDPPPTLRPVSANFIHDMKLNLASLQAFEAPNIDPQFPNGKYGTADRTMKLLNTENWIDGKKKWALNNISYQLLSTPVLAALKYNMKDLLVPTPPDNYVEGFDIHELWPNTNTSFGSGVYTFELEDVVDVILQNALVESFDNHSNPHPWHLHGHDFWVLGYGFEEFDPATARLNYVNPPKMNTAMVFPFAWTYLRFVAKNPGAWQLHCHIEPHLHMGMAVVFAVGVNDLPDIPTQNLGCGLTKNLMNQNRQLG